MQVVVEEGGGGLLRGGAIAPQQKFGVAESPYILVPKNTFTDV